MALPKFKFSTHFPIVIGFVLTLGVGLTVAALQYQQETRTRAALEGGINLATVCSKACDAETNICKLAYPDAACDAAGRACLIDCKLGKCASDPKDCFKSPSKVI